MHHEDLVLQRIDALIDEGQLPTAFELLLRLERQWTAWPGAAERHNRLLMVDGQQRPKAAIRKRAGAAVGFTRRAADYPGLSDAIPELLGTLAAQALQRGDNRAARHFLVQLGDLYPGHPLFQQHSAMMAQQANELLAAAEQAARDGQPGKAADLAEQAAVFWPRTPNLLPRFRPLAQRYQRLRVGVVRLPPADAEHSPEPDPAVDRRRLLTQVPLFEVDRYRNGSAYYRTKYIESWEPYDLGRRLLITLRQTRQPWETQPLLDAPAFAAMLEERLNPASAQFDERLSGYVDSVSVRSPVEVEVRFHRVPARIEPVLAGIVPTSAGAEDAAEAAAAAAFAGGFIAAESDAQHAVFRRATPEPNGLAEYHVAEVVEHVYPSYDKAVLGLRQGEVSMLPDLPDWIVRRVQVDPKLKDEMFIQQYALPTTHVLQINPQSAPLKVRELRRALLSAVDRGRILRDVVLRDPSAAHGRLASSPFPSFSPANSSDVGEKSFDQSAAMALLLAAARVTGNELPTLRMLVAQSPVERAAAAELVRDWKRVRLEVEIVDPGAVTDDDQDWDLAYRTLQIAEPTVALWPFLAAAPTAQITDLSVFPDWLRLALVDIDRTSDWGRALDNVRGLHGKLWSEVRCLPLWEVDGFLVIRKNVQGFPERPLNCYHGIERWTMQAWYPAE
ncbi:MAG: ABC transporter substrate-binding protein [Planctomycetaceae bacterium]